MELRTELQLTTGTAGIRTFPPLIPSGEGVKEFFNQSYALVKIIVHLVFVKGVRHLSYKKTEELATGLASLRYGVLHMVTTLDYPGCNWGVKPITTGTLNNRNCSVELRT